MNRRKFLEVLGLAGVLSSTKGVKASPIETVETPEEVAKTSTNNQSEVASRFDILDK